MGTWLVAVMVVVTLAGCIQTNAVSCSDGRTCPATTVCEPIHQLCVAPEALQSCVGKDDDSPCSGGICDQGVCIEVACGDGVKVGEEQCDGDDFGDKTVTCGTLLYYSDGPVGCTSRCTYDVSQCSGICGDRILNGGEICDDDPSVKIEDCVDRGFYESGDVRCSVTCAPDASACKGFCGDAIVNGGEACEPGMSLPITTCLDNGYDAGRVGCTDFCTPDFSACRHIGWKRDIARSQQSFSSLWMASSNTYFLGSGSFLRVIDKQMDSLPPQLAVEGVWGTASNNVWAVGGGGYIARYDGNSVVQSVAQGAGTDLHDVFGLSSSNLYAVGFGRILQGNGSTWNQIHSVSGANFWSVWASNPNSVFVVGPSGSIYHYDAGWTAEASNVAEELRGVWGSAPNDVFAVGLTGAIVHYAGASWAQQQSGTTEELSSVWGRGASDVFAVGFTGTILHYDGTVWWKLDPGISTNLHDIHGIGERVLAVGDNGGVFYDSHATWALNLPLSPSPSAVDVATLSPTETYVLTSTELQKRLPGAAGFEGIHSGSGETFSAMWAQGSFVAITTYGGKVHRDTNTGDGSWPLAPDNVTPKQLGAITGTSPTQLFAGGSDTQIWRYDGTWVLENNDPGATIITGLWAATATDAFAVGRTASGGVVLRRSSGGTWVVQTLPPANKLNAVWGSSASNVFAVGDVGTILHFDGTTWTRMTSPTGFDLQSVSGSSPTDVFAVGNNGAIIRFDGDAWSEVRSPTQDALRSVSVRQDLVLVGGFTSTFALVRTGAW